MRVALIPGAATAGVVIGTHLLWAKHLCAEEDRSLLDRVHIPVEVLAKEREDGTQLVRREAVKLEKRRKSKKPP
jgi:hypothetical protein